VPLLALVRGWLRGHALNSPGPNYVCSFNPCLVEEFNGPDTKVVSFLMDDSGLLKVVYMKKRSYFAIKHHETPARHIVRKY
jgi:hypothetical protein